VIGVCLIAQGGMGACSAGLSVSLMGTGRRTQGVVLVHQFRMIDPSQLDLVVGQEQGHLAPGTSFVQLDCLAPSDPTSRDQPWVGPSALQGRKASMTKFWTASKCLVFAVISVAPCTIAVAPMSASASRIPCDRASESTSSAARSEMTGVT